MKKGMHESDEWYYASGQLQKRYVSDKSGEAIEPIRLWHENGQLAEELHVKKGKLAGPWLKFSTMGRHGLKRSMSGMKRSSSRNPGRKTASNGEE